MKFLDHFSRFSERAHRWVGMVEKDRLLTQEPLGRESERVPFQTFEGEDVHERDIESIIKGCEQKILSRDPMKTFLREVKDHTKGMTLHAAWTALTIGHNVRDRLEETLKGALTKAKEGIHHDHIPLAKLDTALTDVDAMLEAFWTSGNKARVTLRAAELYEQFIFSMLNILVERQRYLVGERADSLRDAGMTDMIINAIHFRHTRGIGIALDTYALQYYSGLIHKAVENIKDRRSVIVDDVRKNIESAVEIAKHKSNIQELRDMCLFVQEVFDNPSRFISNPTALTSQFDWAEAFETDDALLCLEGLNAVFRPMVAAESRLRSLSADIYEVFKNRNEKRIEALKVLPPDFEKVRKELYNLRVEPSPGKMSTTDRYMQGRTRDSLPLREGMNEILDDMSGHQVFNTDVFVDTSTTPASPINRSKLSAEEKLFYVARYFDNRPDQLENLGEDARQKLLYLLEHERNTVREKMLTASPLETGTNDVTAADVRRQLASSNDTSQKLLGIFSTGTIKFVKSDGSIKRKKLRRFSHLGQNFLHNLKYTESVIEKYNFAPDGGGDAHERETFVRQMVPLRALAEELKKYIHFEGDGEETPLQKAILNMARTDQEFQDDIEDIKSSIQASNSQVNQGGSGGSQQLVVSLPDVLQKRIDVMQQERIDAKETVRNLSLNLSHLFREIGINKTHLDAENAQYPDITTMGLPDLNNRMAQDLVSRTSQNLTRAFDREIGPKLKEQWDLLQSFPVGMDIPMIQFVDAFQSERLEFQAIAKTIQEMHTLRIIDTSPEALILETPDEIIRILPFQGMTKPNFEVRKKPDDYRGQPVNRAMAYRVCESQADQRGFCVNMFARTSIVSLPHQPMTTP